MCTYFNNNKCLLASSIAKIDCPVIQQQCDYCTYKAVPSQAVNVVTVSLAAKYTKDQNNLKPEHIEFILEKKPTHNQSVGTELKRLISWFPIPEKTNCKSCSDLEVKMNKWGAALCLEKMEYIVNQLRLTAGEKKIPFSEFIARTLVNKAIRNSRK